VTLPWASPAAWQDAPYPRVALLDQDRLVTAVGARRSFVASRGVDAATSLAAVPAGAVVVGAARFSPFGSSATRSGTVSDHRAEDNDDAGLPGDAWWVEPDQLTLAARPPRTTNPERHPSAEFVVDVVDRDGPRFRAGVAAALDAIARGRVTKVVLARRFFVPLPGAFARVPSFFSSLLSAPGEGVPYLISPSPGGALVGLSPERLLVIDDDVASDAVAGTRPVARADELLHSRKDEHEHALVVEHLRGALASVAGEAFVGPRGLRVVGAVAHLHTAVRVPRTGSSNASAWVAALHPTPAVAGWPVTPARELIEQVEGFHRGFYGGVVGIVGPRRTALSVALRGAWVTDDGLLVTVGAGVVSGSTVDGEDAETRLKLDAVLSSFGLARGQP
jgi:isochorismate synthase EntC